ncbi:MAG: enoyl-CoA hydratase/isomerase family protein [Alphaproteobacteria bacterium]|nr:enoyl-CoA hydratase/isomerase family protein [Alphaproteobacteria bacterium]
MAALPATKDIRLALEGGVLSLTFNRPEVKNALSREMVGEIAATFEAAAGDPAIRVIVLRGAGGAFCAGGDIKGFRENWQLAEKGDEATISANNRRYGRLLQQMLAQPQAVVAAIEGAAMGGGFGFACVADVSLATADAKFAMPEASMGLLPAQIAPFVVRRIGASETQRLALTTQRIGADEALRLGIIHRVASDAAALDAALAETLADLRRAPPGAVAETKRLIASTLAAPLDIVLDDAALSFARAMRGAEAKEGVLSFIEKRKPKWAV